jgi:CRP-like cAMP-binding protein
MRRRAAPEAILKELASLPLLRACGRAELCRVVNLGTRVTVPDGAVLAREGQRGLEFCILLSGHAHCLIGGWPTAVFGPGDFFGETALLRRGPHDATFVAEGRAELLVLDPTEFNQLINASKTIADKVMTTAARDRWLDSVATDSKVRVGSRK